MKHPYEVFGSSAMDKAAEALIEMRRRVNWADNTVKNSVNAEDVSSLFLLESVVLQIRLCVELYVVSIGILQNVKVKTKSKNDLTKALQKLFPETGNSISASIAAAIPLPEDAWGSDRIISLGGDQKSRIIVVDGDNSYLDRASLLNIFSNCGNALHFNGSKSYAAISRDKFARLSEITEITKRLKRLSDSQITWFEDSGHSLVIHHDPISGNIQAYVYDDAEILMIVGKNNNSAEVLWNDYLNSI